MNTVFHVNFRREAFLRQRARTRQRAVHLGLWVAYFGVLGVLLGLYGLNLQAMLARTAMVKRQTERFRQHNTGGDWQPSRTDAAEIERHVRSPRMWRDRLARLPQLLPANARLSSLQFNPENASGAADLKLVIAGEMRSGAGGDRIQHVMSLVNTLSHDSTFAAGFKNIRLVTTRAASGSDGAEFVIECR